MARSTSKLFNCEKRGFSNCPLCSKI
ncbi:hypothetical protein LINPERPRIM_LOCUS14939 [Linum perenne]